MAGTELTTSPIFIIDGGADVTYISLASTDMMYFTVIHKGTDGGVVITAGLYTIYPDNPMVYRGASK